MLRRRQNVLYLAIILTGFFLHLLLWDQDFLQRLGRSLSSWSAFTAMTDAIFAWVRFYLIRGIGVWMVMMAVFLLFVVLPMLSRWKVSAHQTQSPAGGHGLRVLFPGDEIVGRVLMFSE